MSVMTRCALPLVLFVAALVLCLSPGFALAATEDVSANPGETAQGNPDDWGTPLGRPDDFGQELTQPPNEAGDSISEKTTLPERSLSMTQMSLQIHLAYR